MWTSFIAVVVAAFATAWWWSGASRRRMCAAPILPIERVADGALVKVVGKVRSGGKLLTAPITGRSCVYYSVVVDDLRKGGAYETAEEVHDFLVEDSSGVALVRTTSATVGVVRCESGTAFFRQEAVIAFMAARNHRVKGTDLCIFKEWVIEEGADVAVFGVGRWNMDAALPYRGGERLLTLDAPAGKRLLVDDDPDTGAPASERNTIL